MEWFMDTGIRILVIAVVAIVLFIVARITIPPIIERLISRRMGGEEKRGKGCMCTYIDSSLITSHF